MSKNEKYGESKWQSENESSESASAAAYQPAASAEMEIARRRKIGVKKEMIEEGV